MNEIKVIEIIINDEIIKIEPLNVDSIFIDYNYELSENTLNYLKNNENIIKTDYGFHIPFNEKTFKNIEIGNLKIIMKTTELLFG